MQNERHSANAPATPQDNLGHRTLTRGNRVERLTQRLSLPGTGGRTYLLDLSLDPITHYVLRYRLRPLPPSASVSTALP